MSTVLTNYGARMDYDVALKALIAEGIVVEPGQLSQSFLRLESMIDRTQSFFTFPVLVNITNPGTTTAPTAQLLNPQDCFYATHVGYWLELYTTSNEATPASMRYTPLTYPSFKAGEQGAFVAGGDAYKLWAGVMRIEVNGKVVIPAWDLKRHLNVPEQQKEAYTGAFPDSLFYADHDEFDGATDTFYPMEPNVVFIGNKNTTVTVRFPSELSDVIAASPVQLKMVLTIRGLLAQNASKMA